MLELPLTLSCLFKINVTFKIIIKSKFNNNLIINLMVILKFILIFKMTQNTQNYFYFYVTL
jgi:hypothetical protein